MLPVLWRQSISVARVAIAATALGLFMLQSQFSVNAISAMLLVYVVYALAAALWRHLERREYASWSVFADTLFFLLWASVSATTASFWLTLIFYAFLMGVAVAVHEWEKVATVALTSIVWIVLLQPPQVRTLLPALTCGSLVAMIAVLQKLYLEGRLWNATRQSVFYRYDAQIARQSERERIAADFHDGPLQSFISFQIRLEVVRKLMSRDLNASMSELQQLQDLCKGQVNDLRSFVRSMRPPEEGMSLSASLSRMAEQFQKDTGISASFESGEFQDPPETELCLELLHVVREALNNVHKHSKATRVALAIGKVDNFLEIALDDNGGGFPFSGSYNLDELELLRLGPISIKRRIRILNGDLQLESRPGQGSGLKIRIPA